MFILDDFLDVLFLWLVLAERVKVEVFWRTGDLDREVLLATVQCAGAQLGRERIGKGSDCNQEGTLLCDRRYEKRQKYIL